MEKHYVRNRIAIQVNKTSLKTIIDFELPFDKS